jgi:hypothetical protein
MFYLLPFPLMGLLQFVLKLYLETAELSTAPVAELPVAS